LAHLYNVIAPNKALESQKKGVEIYVKNRKKRSQRFLQIGEIEYVFDNMKLSETINLLSACYHAIFTPYLL
jgi:hypothetical protein